MHERLLITQSLTTKETIEHRLSSLQDTVAVEIEQTSIAQRRPALAQIFDRGASIGRYVVLSKLGAGAMGVVISAYDPQLDRKVALKLLKGPSSAADAAHTRLRREAQALAKLDHRNVVGVHDVGVHAGQLFVAMDFVEGQTLGAWLAEVDEPRPWPEVLRVFIEAGRGLAAAHGAGLVHRDFKPDNVMLGVDGRVRVMDFGLARAGDEDDDPRIEGLTDEDSFRRIRASTCSQALNSGLTQTGAMLGTPAYMAPEQFEGTPADSLSDQFSFCVALHEALYAERPFPAQTWSELVEAVTRGEVGSAPRGAAVPSWLRKIVLRGLARDPAARWPSMEALLAALADDPRAARGKWWGVAGALSLAGIAATAAWFVAQEPAPEASVCLGMDAKLEGVWDEARRVELREAFAATQLGFASETLARVETQLDAYTRAWVDARTQACEATQRGEQSSALLDLGMACLDRRLAHVDATVSILASADADVVPQALSSVLGLPELERCADLDALLAAIPPPEDPQLAARVDALDAKLVEVRALQSTGRYEAGLSLATSVAEAASGLDYEPLQARAWLAQGQLQNAAGDYQAAEATLIQSYTAALASDDDENAARAATTLLFLVGHSLQRYGDAHHWALHAEALSRATGEERFRGSYFSHLGVLAFSERDYDDAWRHMSAGLAIWETLPGPDGHEVHPNVANSLVNLANVATAQERFTEARALLERSIALKQSMYGPEHPTLYQSIIKFADVLAKTGEHAGAQAQLERAMILAVQAAGPGSGLVANVHGEMGRVALGRRAYAAAREHFERELELHEALAPTSAQVGSTLTSLGDVDLNLGELEASQRDFERAVAVFEASVGVDAIQVASPLTGLGRALLEASDPDAALAPLLRAARIREHERSDPEDRGFTNFALARALWDASADHGRDRTRALELARRAESEFAESSLHAEELEACRTWLAERASP